MGYKCKYCGSTYEKYQVNCKNCGANIDIRTDTNDIQSLGFGVTTKEASEALAKFSRSLAGNV